MGVNPSGIQHNGERISLTVVLLIIALFCGFPLVLLFKVGLTMDGSFSLSALAEAVASKSVRNALLNSLDSSFFAALLSTTIGLGLALLIGLTNVRLKGLLVFLILLPMMIPPHVTAISWIQALGPSSPVLQWLGMAPAPGATHPIYSRGGIIALLTIQHTPLVFLIVRAALRNFPRELSDAARVCGARVFRMLIRVIIPLLLPALLSGFVLSFIAALGNFGITALLGIPARYTTLPVLIWRRLSSFGPEMLPNVAVISIILAIITIAILSVQFILQRSLRSSLIGLPHAPLAIDLKKWRSISETGIWIFISTTLLLPLVSLLATALVPTYGLPLSAETLTLVNFTEVIIVQEVTSRAFMNSTLTAGTAALLVALLSIVLGYYLISPHRQLRKIATGAAVLAETSYAIPGLIISIAFILAFIHPIPLLGVSLYGTLWIILIAYISSFFAIGLKPVVAAYHQLDPNLDDAARVTGASFRMRMQRIFTPLVAPTATSGAILVFLTAYNEVTVSSLLWSTGSETIGTVIFNYEDGGYTTLAAAMSIITVFITIILMFGLNLLAGWVPAGVVPWRD